MNYRLELKELEEIVVACGKVNVLKLVREAYIDANADIGLCSVLYCALLWLLEFSENVECHQLTFIDKYDVIIPGSLAYKYIFPQWDRNEAWKLVYEPRTLRAKDGSMADWYRGGWWWPCEDHEARFQFLEKMIDIYERDSLG